MEPYPLDRYTYPRLYLSHTDPTKFRLSFQSFTPLEYTREKKESFKKEKV